MSCRLFTFGLVAPLVILSTVVATESTATSSSSGIRIDLDQQPSAKPAPKPAPSTSAQKSAAEKAKSAPAKKAAPKKDEIPAKIEGVEIARSEHGFLGLKIVDNNFQLTFYDLHKKPIPVDVSSAVLRWPVKYQPNDERTTLTPSSDGKALTSEKVIRPPFVFKLYLMLLKDGGADAQAAENYIIDFQQ
jgi:hypothetical protein